MKITFVATIKGKQQYQSEYNAIVSILTSLGATVFHEHVTRYSQDDLDKMSDDDRVEFHDKIFHKIKDCDVVVAEGSSSSMGVGFLISSALELQKPTIFLFKGKKPTNILGFLEENEKLIVLEYRDVGELKELLRNALDYASDKQDVRFNFFISPEIQRYLDWVAKYKRSPRAVYLRELLERDMRENKEWKKKQ